jgi:tellurite methyltransferase
MPRSSFDDGRNERAHWNEKYLGCSSVNLKDSPDPFLGRAFDEYVRSRFPKPGSALDLAGGTGRNAIWLAQQGWKVTLIDISEVGIEIARREAGSLAPYINFVVDDLIRFKASQISNGQNPALTANPDLVLVFFYLERRIFSEIIASMRPGGLLIYKTYKTSASGRVKGPQDPKHLLLPDELPQLARGLRVLHYREEEEPDRATAELVAQKPWRSGRFEKR